MTAAPARYFPLAHGRYDVAPGLSRFGKDFGNGAADRHIFQLDRSFDHYRRLKLAARQERLGKYFQARDFRPAVARAVTGFILDRLTREHPQAFVRSDGTLSCQLTRESLTFDPDLNLIATDPSVAANPPYADAFDALASQVQEDLAVVSTDGDCHWLSAVHLCFPNSWASEDKVGNTFAAIHEPVAGIEPINRQEAELVRVMVGATDGLLRFAWGVTFDDGLNHHPQRPRGAAPATRFDSARPRAFLRVERQTIWGFPVVGASLFTIRTYLYDCEKLRHDAARRTALVSAIESMTPASLAYKGLAEAHDPLLRWLRTPP
jgi:dimethylamine monooxygenase subunit A